MTTISQKANNDIEIDGTEFVLSSGRVAYDSIISDCIRTLRGELQLDTGGGIDYEGTVWVSKRKIPEWEMQVRRRVIALPFVQGIDSFTVRLDSPGNIRYTMVVKTDLGDVKIFH